MTSTRWREWLRVAFVVVMLFGAITDKAAQSVAFGVLLIVTYLEEILERP